MRRMVNFKKVGGVVAVLALVLGLVGLVKATLSPGAVDLGTTAANFAVLAGSAITDSTVDAGIDITGDVGLSPASGTFITGLTSVQVAGTIYSVDGAGASGSTANAGLLTLAKADLVAAYIAALAEPTDTFVTSDLSTFMGGTLPPGVYEDDGAPASLGLSGTLTLDGGGDPDAVWIFKSATTLATTGAGTDVILTNGAQACNVFWAVGTSATLDTTSTFVGTILAQASITDAGGSTVAGRLLADVDDDGTGAVTLSDTTVTVPLCAPSLILNKTVVNTGGGTAADTDWTLTATGAGGTPTNLSGTDPVNSNVTYSDASFESDTYTLAETGGPADYTASTYSCSTNGGPAVISNTIILGADDDAVCTITNTFVPPSGGGGGGGGGFFTPPSTPTPTPTPTPSATPTPTPTPAPLLPSTGIGPNDNSSAPWNLIIPTGIFVALLSFYLARKKQTV